MHPVVAICPNLEQECPDGRTGLSLIQLNVSLVIWTTFTRQELGKLRHHGDLRRDRSLASQAELSCMIYGVDGTPGNLDDQMVWRPWPTNPHHGTRRRSGMCPDGS